MLWAGAVHCALTGVSLADEPGTAGRSGVSPAAPRLWMHAADPIEDDSSSAGGAYRVREPGEWLAPVDGRFPLAVDAPSAIQLAAGTATNDVVVPAAAEIEIARSAEDGSEPLSRLQWPDNPHEVDAGATLRGVAEGAGLLMAVSVVALWALRHWLIKRTQPQGTGHNLRKIDSLVLPQRCQVHLLDVQGQRVLVAIDGAGVKGVTVLPERFDALVADGDLSRPHAPLTTDNIAYTEPAFA